MTTYRSRSHEMAPEAPDLFVYFRFWHLSCTLTVLVPTNGSNVNFGEDVLYKISHYGVDENNDKNNFNAMNIMPFVAVKARFHIQMETAKLIPIPCDI